MKDQNNLCWLDMEMTGLNPETDKIIEVAMIITDKDLNVLAQSEVFAIHQSDEIMDNMDEWCTATHARTGLTARVKASPYNEAEVEQKLLDFMGEWLKELARRWYPAVYKGVVKKGSHKALDDILESIEELKYYRDTFLRLPAPDNTAAPAAE